MPDTELDLGGVQRQNLREQCLTKLRGAIENGTLSPGQRLVEARLSTALNVSRGTLREAMRVLAQEGLIAADERGRMIVQILTREEVHDIFAVRSALECLAARTIATSPDRDQAVNALKDSLEPLKQSGAPLETLMDSDMAFHRLMITLSGNATLLRSWDHILGQVRATIVRAGLDAARHNMAWERHIPLVRAIATGDPDAAAEMIDAHMSETADRVVATVFA